MRNVDLYTLERDIESQGERRADRELRGLLYYYTAMVHKAEYGARYLNIYIYIAVVSRLKYGRHFEKCNLMNRRRGVWRDGVVGVPSPIVIVFRHPL